MAILFPGLFLICFGSTFWTRDAVARVYWLDYKLIPRHLDTWSKCPLTRSVFGTISLMLLQIDSKGRSL